ncbi:MAG: putative DNA modification/repair radical SAM protein [Candidatus Altiarchaeales archaeon]|nr:putative DNA modification/repair radical SAM protein [Candidatus Altiarchaeales archaeon]MBD3416262.1 putative DNA modification/repair radical SAM protein [Candidatus Altiarchaeales archaeon]
MDIVEKVRVLGDAGKWDTCASTASPRKEIGGDRIGNAAAGGICHSFTEDGRCVSLFKTLYTNKCSMDCRYCQNSTHCPDRTHVEYDPEELAKVFMHLYTGNYVEGLFLSSGIAGDPDTTTEKMLEAAHLVRDRYNFRGYLHFKILPGTNRDYVKQAGGISDRLSINLEAPGRSRLSEISQVKDYNNDILRRQRWIKKVKPPSGQTTQLVVGGSGETDREILETADWEYRKVDLKRVYYSAFTPIEKTPLEGSDRTPLEREHRLYNVDFMLRRYNIPLKEFKEVMVDDNLPNGDPKLHLARNYFDRPVDVNTATYDELIRVPGIGPRSVQRIMDIRGRKAVISKRSQLKSIGVVLKRAEPFLSISGHSQKRMIEWVT